LAPLRNSNCAIKPNDAVAKSVDAVSPHPRATARDTAQQFFVGQGRKPCRSCCKQRKITLWVFITFGGPEGHYDRLSICGGLAEGLANSLDARTCRKQKSKEVFGKG
jgi:hypothetical protein